MVIKVESRSIVFSHKTKLYKQTNKYDDEIPHKFLCWDVDTGQVNAKTKEKMIDTYGIAENEFKDYFENPSTHSVKVWAMLKGSADFIATLREFTDQVSYVYDVDKKIMGVIFHDDTSCIWSV